MTFTLSLPSPLEGEGQGGGERNWQFEIDYA